MKTFTSWPRAGRQSAVALAVCAASAGISLAAHAQGYQETDLISDLAGRAALQDPNLSNAWGMSFAPGGSFWFSDNATGLSTLASATGTSIPALVVTVPPAPGSPAGSIGNPTGQVFSGASGVQLPSGQSSVFTFATEDGTLSGWNPAAGNTALVAVNNSTKGLGSVYKGLEIATSGSKTQLYATDFRNGAVDVFDNHFNAVNLSASAFTDPNLPAGYAPFNIAQMNGKLLVTYAQQDADKRDDVHGAGHGFVDEYNLDGSFSKRLITGGALNSPWGVALAPGNFGAYSGDLLVGNFGDGTINAYDPTTGAYKGTIKDAKGNPLTINGLWGLSFRTDVPADGSKLFFTAGLNDEANGLFGSISAVPEPASWCLMLLGLSSIGIWGRGRRS